jgi:hypothetical protein
MPIAFPTTGLTNGQEYSPPGITGVKYTYNAAKGVWVGAVAGTGSSFTLLPATVSQLGGVKVGTGLTAGVDGTLSVSGGTTSITANGYTYAGGVLIQWGYVAAVPIDKHTAVTFPIAFPSSVFSVVASLVNTLAPADYWSINNIIQVGAVTRTGFHVINNKAYNNDIDLPAYWLALGY